ncbi:MAG: hypothetical protein WC765_03975, partial [Phycisphaerae bacterium]
MDSRAVHPTELILGRHIGLPLRKTLNKKSRWFYAAAFWFLQTEELFDYWFDSSFFLDIPIDSGISGPSRP